MSTPIYHGTAKDFAVQLKNVPVYAGLPSREQEEAEIYAEAHDSVTAFGNRFPELIQAWRDYKPASYSPDWMQQAAQHYLNTIRPVDFESHQALSDHMKGNIEHFVWALKRHAPPEAALLEYIRVLLPLAEVAAEAQRLRSGDVAKIAEIRKATGL